MIGKDPREITSFFGTNSAFGRYKVQETAPDPLLLPFLCNFSLLDPKCRQQDKSSVCDNATTEIERYVYSFFLFVFVKFSHKAN